MIKAYRKEWIRMAYDFNASTLKSEYFDWLNEQESFNDVGSISHPVVEIQTPFLDQLFVGIDLYIYPSGINQVMITDNGYTLDGLEINGIVFDKRTKTRNKILEDVLDSFGIERKVNSKKLFIISRRDEFPNAKQRLLQGILKIIDLNYTESTNVINLFADTVADVFSKQGILFNRSRAVVAPNGRSFVFDFMIPTKKKGDTLVRTFHSPQFTNSAKVYSWDASFINKYSANKPGKFLAVIDDKNANKDQVDSFNEILNADEQAVVQGITFSNINEQIDLFLN